MVTCSHVTYAEKFAGFDLTSWLVIVAGHVFPWKPDISCTMSTLHYKVQCHCIQLYMLCHVQISLDGYLDRQRERRRERHNERDKWIDRRREKETERDKERHREIERGYIERQNEGDRYTHRQRYIERQQRERKAERERARKSELERQREIILLT